jgi:nitrogen fixation/metabolism regulation signal transduction histidine kinase
VRTRIGAESVLRMVMRVDLGGGPEATPGVALLTARLPDRFDETARGLTRAVDIFAGLERLRTTFVLVVAVLYGVFASPILLLAVLAGFFMADRILRPIESLEDATRRVTEGDYSVRILSRPNDDLGLLVLSFNRMVTELDRARRRMAQAEKVQAWQEIAQRLAHEVKNPLTPIRLAAERLHRRYEAGAADFPVILERTVATIVREVDELTALLNEFRSFSRMPEPHRERCALAPVVRDIGAIYRDDPAVSIDGSAVPEEMVLFADRGQLRQVLLNLVANAVEASLDRGRSVVIRIAAHRVRLGESEFTRIVVADNGPGIPEELRTTLFEPYVTGKAHGTGLGLAIVERIVFDHEGRITVESAPGSGTTFVIDLPVESATP